MSQLGDLNVRLVLEVIQADASAKKFETSLNNLEQQSKKTQTGVSVLGTKSKQAASDIHVAGAAATEAAGQVSFLGEAMAGIGNMVKMALWLAAIEFLFTAFKELTTVIDRFKEFQERIDKVTESISASTEKIITLTKLQGQFQNYNNLSTIAQKKLNDQLIEAVQLYPDIVSSVSAYNGVLNLNTDSLNNVIDREKNLVDLRRNLLISDQAAQIKNLVELYEAEIKSVDDINRYLKESGYITKDNGLTFEKSGKEIKGYGVVVHDISAVVGGLTEKLTRSKNEAANLQLKFLEAIQQGLKFGDVNAVLDKIHAEISGNTEATKFFFDTIAQLTGSGIDNWDALRNALVNYKNELASLTTNNMVGPPAPTPNILSKRISELQEQFKNEPDANVRKGYLDDIKAIQKELDKMNGVTPKTSSAPHLKKGKELLSLLTELQKQLDEIDKKIAIQSKGESDVEGLFIKKKDIETEIELIKAVNTEFKDYLNLRDNLAGQVKIDEDKKPLIELIPVDDLLRMRVEMQDWIRKSEQIEKNYQKIVSDLDAAANIALILSQRLGKGGKDLFYWINAALQVTRQIMALAKAGKSKEGIGFGDILGFVGGILPFFLAGGGSVPGSGSGDTVPAMLTPGEYVINKSAVSRLGTNMLNWLNGGGVVSQKSVALPGMGSMVVINLSGELTDHLRHDIVSKGNVVVNMRKKNSNF